MPTVSERSARRLWGVWLSDRVRVTTLGGCNAEVRHFDNIAAAQQRAARRRQELAGADSTGVSGLPSSSILPSAASTLAKSWVKRSA